MKHLFIVQRAQPETFTNLRTHFAEDVDVEVIWDRRLVERRTRPQPGTRKAGPTGERRRASDRRRALPESWQFAGFVFVPGGSVNSSSSAPARPQAS